MNATKLLFVFLFISSMSYGQYIGSELLDDSKIEQPDLSRWYSGVYRFGVEGRKVELWVTLKGRARITLTTQLRTQVKSNDGKTLVWRYQNFTSTSSGFRVKIGRSTIGQFGIYDGKDAIMATDTVWAGAPGWEVGLKADHLSEYFPGDYRQASMYPLTLDSLTNFTAQQLQRMRNEIFARYGYTFKAGGEMDKYFKTKNWYYPNYDNVDEFLTELEKANIKLILEKEGEAKKDENYLASRANLKTAKYAGEFSIPSSNEGAYQRLTIFPETDQSVLFYIEANRGEPNYNSGSLSGRIKIVNGKNEFISSDNHCGFSVQFLPEGVKITVTKDDFNCGMGGGLSINGLYTTDSRGISMFYETSEGTASFRNMSGN